MTRPRCRRSITWIASVPPNRLLSSPRLPIIRSRLSAPWGAFIARNFSREAASSFAST